MLFTEHPYFNKRSGGTIALTLTEEKSSGDPPEGLTGPIQWLSGSMKYMGPKYMLTILHHGGERLALPMAVIHRGPTWGSTRPNSLLHDQYRPHLMSLAGTEREGVRSPVLGARRRAVASLLCRPHLAFLCLYYIQARERIRISVFSAGSVLEGDVVRVNHLYPPDRLAHGVRTLVKPTHGTVVRPQGDLLSIKIVFKVF